MENNNRRRLEHCLRCGHSWFTRKSSRPKVCGKCRSPYWDTPKKTKKVDVQSKLEQLKQSIS